MILQMTAIATAISRKIAAIKNMIVFVVRHVFRGRPDPEDHEVLRVTPVCEVL